MLNQKEKDFFRKKLLELRASILNHEQEIAQVTKDDLADESDFASSTLAQELSFSMKQRDLMRLRNIGAALERLEKGTFGICESCGEMIEEKRLQNQPLATLCIFHAEEEERAQNFYKKGGLA